MKEKSLVNNILKCLLDYENHPFYSYFLNSNWLTGLIEVHKVTYWASRCKFSRNLYLNDIFSDLFCNLLVIRTPTWTSHVVFFPFSMRLKSHHWDSTNIHCFEVGIPLLDTLVFQIYFFLKGSGLSWPFLRLYQSLWDEELYIEIYQNSRFSKL